MLVWHELNIHLDRSLMLQNVEPNVGGIRCNEINEEPKQLITINSMGISETTVTINELNALVSTEMPNESKADATNETTTNEKGNSNLELLLFALCAIMLAFLVLHFILNKERFLAQIGYSKRKQNHFHSTATLSTETTVAFSPQFNSSDN